jgi:hypothetical protein
VNNLPANNRKYGLNAFDAFLRDGKIVVGERNQIGQLSNRNRALLSALT